MAQIKRGISFVLTVSMVFCLTICVARANTTASDYLAEYTLVLYSGKVKGKFDLSYDVMAPRTSDSIGISQIDIYKSDNTYVTTIYGSTKNGLIVEQDYSHTGVYTCSGVSGNYYYAKVTVFAERGGGSDSRTITTNTVRVP